MLVNSIIAVAVALATAANAQTSTSGLPAAQVPGFPQDKCPQTFFANENYAKYLVCIESSSKALNALSDDCKKTDKQTVGDNPTSAPSWPVCSCDAHNVFPKCIEDAGICPDGIKAYRGLFPGACVTSTSGLPSAEVPGFPQKQCPKSFFENENYAKFLTCVETSSKALDALSDDCKKTDKDTLGDNPTSAASWPTCSCDAHNAFPKCIEDAGICADGIKAYRGLFPGACGAAGGAPGAPGGGSGAASTTSAAPAGTGVVTSAAASASVAVSSTAAVATNKTVGSGAGALNVGVGAFVVSFAAFLL
ncbi:hypothetical protein HDU97_004959 [Phlyctochytrium planicorne]|nr:hypothetical protein HDU97_004959 [Phlyctochytrium planicorne]